MTRELLIFPFGLIILSIFGIIIFFIFSRNIFELSYGSKWSDGITEYPSVISVLLCGTNEDSITFSGNGRSVVVEDSSNHRLFNDTASLKSYVKEKMQFNGSDYFMKFVDFLSVESNVRCSDSGNLHTTISISDEAVYSRDYIEHEIANIGRVFTRNSSNNVRWLLYPDGGERRVTEIDGKICVYISRTQLVPGLTGERTRVMSERQITRNIQNRLWNRYEVTCTSIGKHPYCGELVRRDSLGGRKKIYH